MSVIEAILLGFISSLLASAIWHYRAAVLRGIATALQTTSRFFSMLAEAQERGWLSVARSLG